MTDFFNYGAQKSHEIDTFEAIAVPIRRTSEEFFEPTSWEEETSSLREKTYAAWQNPVDYLPLKHCLVEGDVVVLPIEPGIPHVGKIVAGTLDALLKTGTQLGAIKVLSSASDLQSEEAFKPLIEEFKINVQWEQHDPLEDQSVCFAGMLGGKTEYRLNRIVFDADFVIPIGLATTRTDWRPSGAYTALHPLFTEPEAFKRFNCVKATFMEEHRKNLQAEVNQSGFLIGVTCVLQVLPSFNDTVAEVVVGETRAVNDQIYLAAKKRWSYSIPMEVDLAILPWKGSTNESSWENIGRALKAAEHVLTDEGAVLICTDLTDLPGFSIRRLASEDDRGEVLKKLNKEAYPDTWTAHQLCKALERGKVYFVGEAEPSLLEELGMIVVEDQDLDRVIDSYRTFTLIPDAPYVDIQMIEEDEEL